MSYPKTISDILDPNKKFKPAVIRMLSRAKLWRGSLQERTETLRQVNRRLAEIYTVEEPRLLFETDQTRCSGSSCYIPATRTIILRGRLSIITYLHEFAHHRFRSSDEKHVTEWSVNLYRKIWPKSFAKLRHDGHMLRAR